MKTKSKIRWKFLKRVNCHEGFVNGELAFSVEGSLCVTDIRKCYTQSEYISPNHYRIKDPNHGKQIAHDLLEGLNVEEHETNRLEWIAQQERTTKLIQDTDELIKQLQLKNSQ